MFRLARLPRTRHCVQTLGANFKQCNNPRWKTMKKTVSSRRGDRFNKRPHDKLLMDEVTWYNCGIVRVSMETANMWRASRESLMSWRRVWLRGSVGREGVGWDEIYGYSPPPGPRGVTRHIIGYIRTRVQQRRKDLFFRHSSVIDVFLKRGVCF